MEETQTEELKKAGSFLKDKSSFLGTSILVSAIIVSGTLVYVFGPSVRTDVNPNGPDAQTAGYRDVGDVAGAPEIGGASVLGNPDAPVTIVEYSDFECPFCAKFFDESLGKLEEEYVATGKVKFVYKDFPLTSIHFEAEKASEAARCVREELGDIGFWAMHDIMFERQDLLGVSSYKQWARSLGANGAAFDECLDSGKYESQVLADLDEGVALGVTGTPTFFINDTKVVGAVPYAQIVSIIETELAASE